MSVCATLSSLSGFFFFFFVVVVVVLLRETEGGEKEIDVALRLPVKDCNDDEQRETEPHPPWPFFDDDEELRLALHRRRPSAGLQITPALLDGYVRRPSKCLTSQTVAITSLARDMHVRTFSSSKLSILACLGARVPCKHTHTHAGVFNQSQY